LTDLLTRRRFIAGTAAAAGTLAFGPAVRHAYAANSRPGIAFIGVGGRGGAHLGLGSDPKAKDGKFATVAICDVDRDRLGGVQKRFPNAAAYTDFRELLDKHDKQIDAVVVSTPDHTHFVAAYAAMTRGKHCYCEKPLTYAPWEARALADLTGEKKLATQMGNQGHANEGNRLAVAFVRSGELGDITAIHTWTNRPVWPQGPGAAKAADNPGKPPEHLDWNNWIGPRPDRPYHGNLHAFKWRGWLDFGTGTIGDMGCHTWDGPFWAMNPTYPESVEIVKAEGVNDQTYPNKQVIKFRFPAEHGRPGFDAYWYDGGLKPDRPDELPGSQGLPGSGSLYVGTKGKMMVWGDYGGAPRLIPEAFQKAVGKPERVIDPSPGHHREWVMAVTGEKPWDYPKSNFTYGGRLTETMLLGGVALRVPGRKIECDWQARKVVTAEAAPFYKPAYREAWMKDLGVKVA